MASDDFWRLTVGIPVCRQHEYDAFRSIFVDAHSLPATWQEFMELMDESEQIHEDQGHRVIRVEINPRTFPDWCAQNSRRIDARARYDYARIIAQSQADRDPG